jgi:methionyl-tRNA formyltransferase
MTEQIKEKFPVVFIGSSAKGLRELCQYPTFFVQKALCLRGRVTEPLEQEAKQFDVPLERFQWHSDFRDKILHISSSVSFFIYQLDMLVPADLALERPFYNLHRGCLRTNRGPCPEIWSLLLGDRRSFFSLHKINDKIDAGIEIARYEVLLNRNDTVTTLKSSMEKGFQFLLEIFEQYLRGKVQGESLVSGRYRRWIREDDFTIDLERDSVEVMRRKIQCQKTYNGAIVLDKGKRYFVTELLLEGDESLAKTRCDSKNLVKFHSREQVFYFRRNCQPKFLLPRRTSSPSRI